MAGQGGGGKARRRERETKNKLGGPNAGLKQLPKFVHQHVVVTRRANRAMADEPLTSKLGKAAVQSRRGKQVCAIVSYHRSRFLILFLKLI